MTRPKLSGEFWASIIAITEACSIVVVVAGHADESGEQDAIGACLQGGRCDGITSRVAKIDVDSLNAEEIIRYPSNDLFLLGTVAIQVNDEIWLGGIGGRDRIARFSVP